MTLLEYAGHLAEGLIGGLIGSLAGSAVFANLTVSAPWFLSALLLLPLLWWLFKVTPERPRSVRFAAIFLLQGLNPGDIPARGIPLWLALLRCLAVVLLILAMARPLINSGNYLPANGPLILVMDDGWAAAQDWDKRRDAAIEVIGEATRKGRSIILLTTAPPENGDAIVPSSLMKGKAAAKKLHALAPKPWPVDREGTLKALDTRPFNELQNHSANVVWISDGLDGPHVDALAGRLQRLGNLRILQPHASRLPKVLAPPVQDERGLNVTLSRTAQQGKTGAAFEEEETVPVRLWGENGDLISRIEARFKSGEVTAQVRADLPLEMRNRITRINLGENSGVGATYLLDGGWRRHSVGLVRAGSEEDERPLLGDLYYLERALSPYTRITKGDLDELLENPPAVLIMPDAAARTPDRQRQVLTWIEKGGVLLRFAGPRIASHVAGQAQKGSAGEDADKLVPVRLRRGNRALGGVMSWNQPVELAPFDQESPFFGLAIPEDVRISRQVLAEPTADLTSKTWAQLADGTPLVTAKPVGAGWLILIHTTANSRWSNLPLSGLFVEMLLRITALSHGEPPTQRKNGAPAPLAPWRVLDGFGALAAPGDTVLPLVLGESISPGPGYPPGYYGAAAARQAFNLPPFIERPVTMGNLPDGVVVSPLNAPRATDLTPYLLAAAFVLIIIDTLISLYLRDLLKWPGPLRARQAFLGAGVLLLSLTLGPLPSAADTRKNTEVPGDAFTADEFILAATSKTRLAYVLTGDARIDEKSRQGLMGLSRVVSRRSAAELAEPLGVDPTVDDLVFFPLLYWPVLPERTQLAREAADQLNDFMENGGTILFDTLEPSSNDSYGGPAGEEMASEIALRRIAREVNLPPLTPLPGDHVLTRSFYLVQDAPGRLRGGPLWVAAAGRSHNDGVSPVIIGSNDWAGAWALDDGGLPLYPVVPGGEAQREKAFRFGVNLVMYVLTGNYKADQVHVPSILERLGQ